MLTPENKTDDLTSVLPYLIVYIATRIYSNIQISGRKIRYLNMNTQLSVYKYCLSSYLIKFIRMNIFDIHIRSGCEEQIYLIFIFLKNVYIRYSYLVKLFYKDILICIPCQAGSRKSSYNA